MHHLYKNKLLLYNEKEGDEMKEKTDLRIIKTKNLLYQTLEELMKTKSFEEIKVSDICNMALINRSTFYFHYSDKYELFQEYVEHIKYNITQELNKNTNIQNTKEYYMEMLKLLLNHIEEKKDTYTKIMVNNKNSITMDIFYDAINKDIVKQIKDDNEIPGEIISKFYLGAVLNVCTYWLRNSNKYQKEDIIKYINMLIPNKLHN